MTTADLILSQLQSAGGQLPYLDLVLGFPVQTPAPEITAAIAQLQQSKRLEYQGNILVLTEV